MEVFGWRYSDGGIRLEVFGFSWPDGGPVGGILWPDCGPVGRIFLEVFFGGPMVARLEVFRWPDCGPVGGIFLEVFVVGPILARLEVFYGPIVALFDVFKVYIHKTTYARLTVFVLIVHISYGIVHEMLLRIAWKLMIMFKPIFSSPHIPRAQPFGAHLARAKNYEATRPIPYFLSMLTTDHLPDVVGHDV